MKRHSGFALVTVFLMLTVATLLVSQLYFKGLTYNTFIPAAINREQAKLVARSGIQIALNQLSLLDSQFLSDKKDEKKDASQSVSEEKDPIKRAKNLLSFLLKVQHRWQTFEFDEKRDGFEGTLKLCISCEEGKIPLKSLIDGQKRTFAPLQSTGKKPDEFFKFIFQKMKELTFKKDLYPSFEKYIKERKFDWIDVTDVFAYEGFESLSNFLFYAPEPLREGIVRKDVYWSDLFTVWVDTQTIHPLLFSPSVRRVFDLNVDQIGVGGFEDEHKKIVEKLDLQLSAWHADWDNYIEPLYQKDYARLPKELIALLSTKFEPRVFSVLCYGKVGKIEQKLLVIIVRTFDKNGEVFEVKKLYWL